MRKACGGGAHGLLLGFVGGIGCFRTVASVLVEHHFIQPHDGESYHVPGLEPVRERHAVYVSADTKCRLRDPAFHGSHECGRLCGVKQKPLLGPQFPHTHQSGHAPFIESHHGGACALRGQVGAASGEWLGGEAKASRIDAQGMIELQSK